MDKELKDLESYNGTIEYTKSSMYRNKLTDGIVYIMNNGYIWFVTDVLAVIETNLKNEPFLSITLKVDNNKGNILITDGNKNELYTQEIKYTDAKKELHLYHTDGVMMLAREY